jgi:phage terminase large subunit GpA-like protein
MEAMKTPEPLTLHQWAERNFYLSAESSQGEKRWESFPYQRGLLCMMGDDHIQEVDLVKSARVGYALALDTPIVTAAGWKRMGEMVAGDVVFDEKGQRCNVLYVSEVYTDHACYKIAFDDDSEIVADAGHRWFVESDVSLEHLNGERGTGRTGRPRPGVVTRKSGVVDTAQLYNMQRTSRGRTSLAVPCAKPLDCEPVELPIPPYFLGLWLGDGHSVTPRVTQHKDDVETADFVRAEGVEVFVQPDTKRDINNVTYFFGTDGGRQAVSPWAKVFRGLGLLGNKHIPSLYLRSSVRDRLELLRGLMDSDGTVGASGRAEFNNTSQVLAEGVRELVSSLGMKSTIRVRYPRRAHHWLQYRVNFKPTPAMNPFKLARKAAMVKDAAKPSITHRRRIVSVTPVDPVPVRCIQVDSPNSLFLCGRAMIPTHNTKMLLASIAYGAQHKRRNQCVWQPTDADSDEFCKAEVEPMLRDVKVMKSVFPSHIRKSKANTLNMKKFLGSILFMKGGTSSGNYRRMTLQTFYADEFSAFDEKIEKSADPWTLMWKRLEGATWPKAIVGSTPRVKHADHTERRFLAAQARMRFYVDCPRCGVEHPLTWGGPDVQHGFKWESHDPEGTVHHVCPHCHGKMTQAEYLRTWDAGIWVSDCGNYRCHAMADGTYYWTDGQGCRLLSPPRHVGAHVWTAYSPQTTWAVIVREFLHALQAFKAGDKGPMEGFVNETRGETWEDEVEKTDSHELQRRAEPYPLRRVPVGGLDLVASVDTQDKWWAVTVMAVGRAGEHWIVDYVEFDGNPGDERDWESKLYPYLKSTFYHWHGAPMMISGVGVDTGGNHTHQAYNFCRTHAAEKFFALKGDSVDGKPIKSKASTVDVNHKGRVIKRGLKLWWVGTDTAKDLIFSRLTLKSAGPGYIHFSQGLPSQYYLGLTSEVRRQIRTASGLKHRWVKVRDRNEPLDTLVYCLFVSHALDHHKFTERQWERLEKKLDPEQFVPVDSPARPATETHSVIDVNAKEIAERKEDASAPSKPREAPTGSQPERVSIFDMAYGN